MDPLIERIKAEIFLHPPLFISEKGTRPIPLPPPVTPEELAESEKRMNLRLPQLLREIYLNVGNGGFGPGYAINGITPTGWKDDHLGETALSNYLKITESKYYYNKGIGFLPLFHCGCAEHAYLDCRDEEGWLELPYNQSELMPINLRQWLEKWLTEWANLTLILPEGYFDNTGGSLEYPNIP